MNAVSRRAGTVPIDSSVRSVGPARVVEHGNPVRTRHAFDQLLELTVVDVRDCLIVIEIDDGGLMGNQHEPLPVQGKSIGDAPHVVHVDVVIFRIEVDLGKASRQR